MGHASKPMHPVLHLLVVQEIARWHQPHAKPHPAPLLHAAGLCKVEPGACIYVGDDLRDVQAGRAAGMKTIAVTWGYLGEGEPPQAWGADAVIDAPSDVLGHL